MRGMRAATGPTAQSPDSEGRWKSWIHEADSEASLGKRNFVGSQKSDLPFPLDLRYPNKNVTRQQNTRGVFAIENGAQNIQV